MKVWVKAGGATRQGKFLVVRRDGSIPAWPHFVMGGRDPAVPHALRAYADKAGELGMDPEYVVSVRELADDFEKYRKWEGEGDADAPPHRKDDPKVIRAMEGDDSTISVWASRNIPKPKTP